MQDKALYLLAKFDQETQNTLAGYYGVLQQNGFVGNQTKDIPYHITLGSRSIDCEKQTINDLDKICSDASCFEINLAHIGLFGMNVLFISPNMNFELLKLQQCFFPDGGNGYHLWAAHVTLLIDQPEMIHKALPITAENFEPFKAQIESVALYEFFPARFIHECKLRR